MMTDSFNVPHGTTLEPYFNLLMKWQSSINLVSSSTLENAWERHFLDSLQLLPYLCELDGSIVDLGTGAGFPGLVISLTTGRHVSLIESDRKKCLFLKEVIRQTHANATVHNIRIEDYIGPKADIVISRALASLSKILAYSTSVLREDGTLLLLKGEKLKFEIAEAEKKWQFKYEIFSTGHSPDGKIIKIWDIT